MYYDITSQLRFNTIKLKLTVEIVSIFKYIFMLILTYVYLFNNFQILISKLR